MKELPADLQAIVDGIKKSIKEGASADDVMKEAKRLIEGSDE